MSIDILFIEDNPHKRERTKEFILGLDPSLTITEALSFSSGCQELDSKKFDLVLLDISMPTYDKKGSESGGRFRTLAGREIARKIIRKKLSSRILFITQFGSFSDKGTSYSFDGLKTVLAQECGENFAGMLLYDSSSVAWKEEMTKVIRELRK